MRLRLTVFTVTQYNCPDKGKLVINAVTAELPTPVKLTLYVLLVTVTW